MSLYPAIASLTHSFDDIVDASQEANIDDEHDPEGTTVAFERAQVSALLRQAKADRATLSGALEAVDSDPHFGTCTECHRFIGIDRLLALPSATRCVDCAR